MSTMTLDSELDELLYQSVVDDEFRSDLVADPLRFGLDFESLFLPEPVEPQNQDLLDIGFAGVDVVYMCGSTCSSGPFTVVCDGCSK
jgi:hypothetical protein